MTTSINEEGVLCKPKASPEPICLFENDINKSKQILSQQQEAACVPY